MKASLQLTNEQLDTLEKLAGDFFTVEECAIALEVDGFRLETAIKDREHDAHKRYYKGRMTEVARHRKNVKDLSNMGSSPAQALVDKYIEQSKKSS